MGISTPHSHSEGLLYIVSDDGGRVLNSEVLPARAEPRDRLRRAHRSYQLQDWAVGPLLRERWSFTALRDGRRILVAIRRPAPACVRDSGWRPKGCRRRSTPNQNP